jgi:hypothetical protein
MLMNQVAEIVNDLSGQYLGDGAVANVDLSNVVDIGTAVMDLNNLDHYVHDLIDHIGKVVMVNRAYRGKTPSLVMDAWEYGAVLEKITYDEYPEAQQNDSWDLQDQQSYDPNIFYKPNVSAKFFQKRNTFDIPMSFAKRQVKSAFSSATQVNAFFSMIETIIQNSMTLKMDQLVESAINNMIAVTMKDANANRAVNLLSRFNTATGGSLTADKAITNPDFLRFASYIMKLYSERIQRMSKLFNVGGKERFTPSERLHIVLLSEFAAGAEAYLYSDTFHDQFVHLAKAETVPYWQGSGTDYAFASTSKIMVTPNSGAASEEPFTGTGILGVMFDRDAVGISNLDRRVTTNWNARAEFFNNWYKFDAGYYNDPNENFIVFYVA